MLALNLLLNHLIETFIIAYSFIASGYFLFGLLGLEQCLWFITYVKCN